MRIYQESLLHIGLDEAWEKLQQTKTLAEVARGMMSYDTVAEWPERWEVGQEINLRPRLFGILSPSDHFVRVVAKDDAQHYIVTEEHGGAIKRWSHCMWLQPLLNGSACIYRDEVLIDAGFFTPAIWLFAKVFYAHRHWRWKKRVMRRRD